MKTVVKSAIAAVALSVISTSAALAAQDCCCKGKDGKMACCDKKAPAPAAPQTPNAPEAPHQH